jgi:hypothetical protein
MKKPASSVERPNGNLASAAPARAPAGTAPAASVPAVFPDSSQPAHSIRRRARLALLAGIAAGALLVAGGAFFLVYRSVESGRHETTGTDPNSHLGARKSGSKTLVIESYADRNALRDSLLVGDRIFALSSAGNLLAFDRASFSWLGERKTGRSFRCIGPGDDQGIYAGLSNGAIVRVNSADLSLTQLGEVDGRPEWIGRRKAGLLVAMSNPSRASYGSSASRGFAHKLKDLGTGRDYPLDAPTRYLLDSQDRLWVGSEHEDRVTKLQVVDLAAGTIKEIPAKGGWDGLQGLAELGEGQIWAFGGSTRPEGPASFIVRVDASGKSVALWSASGDRAKLPPGAPDTPITQILPVPGRAAAIVVSTQDVVEVDAKVKEWKSMGSVGFKVQHGVRADLRAVGRAHLDGERVILTLAGGGFMDITADSSHRHLLDGQDSVSLPTEIERMGDGLAFYGHGGPLLYARGAWRAVPETVAPPRDLMGAGRNSGEERVWAALVSIPLDDKTNVIVAKAGPPRTYNGHMHGLKDTFVTGQWKDGSFKVMSQEDIALEPDDTFATPDKQLWNVDNQGLWNYSAGKWRMVMSLPSSSHGAVADAGGALDVQAGPRILSVKSAVGEPLRFVAGVGPPWIGLPFGAFAWAMARLDLNEAGGIPLIDDVPVAINGVRVQIRDALAWSKGRLLLATNQGLCLYDLRWGNCQALAPSGLDDEVGVLMRDRSKRVWVAGRGLWLLESESVARPLHPAVPALSEAEVVSMAEAPDGRLALGLVGRGAVFLDVPPKWLQRAPKLSPQLEFWQVTRSFEGHHSDQAVVVRSCRPSAARGAADSRELAFEGLKTQLAGAVLEANPRVHLGEECALGRRPDIGIYGTDADRLEVPVLAVLRKSSLWSELAVAKRYGPPGSRSVDVKTCEPGGDKK